MIAGPAVLLLVVGFLIGLVLVYRGWRGVPMLSEPRCAKCGYDLRGFAGAPPAVCSECGSDLTKPHAVRWGQYRRRPRLIWAGAAVAGVPLLLFAAMLIIVARGSRIDRFPQSNRAVIASLAKTADSPWDWQELQRRRAAGSLSGQEASQAVDELIAFLGKSKGPAGSGPLTWSEPFLTQADAAGDIPPEQYLRLAKAYYGRQPVVRYTARVRQGKPLRFAVTYGGHWNLPGVELVKALRAVKLPDGREAALTADDDYEVRSGQAKPNRDYMSAAGSWEIAGEADLDLPPGEHTLTFVVDAGLLKAGAAPQVVSNKPGQARHWPQGRARWTVESTAKVTIVPADQSPLELVTDPAQDPQTAGGLTVRSAKATRKGTGQRVKVEMDFGRRPVPLSFDVFARVAGKEYPLGWHVVGPSSSQGTEHAHDLDNLPADVRTVDVILRPNPAHAETVPGIERVWGKAVEIPGVKLERYDLESGGDPVSK